MRAPLPLRRLLLLLPLALLAGAVARAEDQAVEKTNAIVTFRRGDTFAGEVSVMGGRGLTIAPTGATAPRAGTYLQNHQYPGGAGSPGAEAAVCRRAGVRYGNHRA